MPSFKKNSLLNILLPTLVIILALTIILFTVRPKNSSVSDQSEYTNPEYGFTLIYPNNWSVSAVANPIQFFETSTTSGLRKLKMEIFATPQTLPLDQFMASQNSTFSAELRTLKINNQLAYEEKINIENQKFLSYYLQNPLSSTMYVLTFNTDLIGQNALIEKILAGLKFLPPQNFILPTIPISASPNKGLFVCPTTSWIDCMPGESLKPLCTKEYIDWAGLNCPEFEGVAY